MRLLAARQHSTSELSRKLARRGYEPDDVEPVLERLRERGYLDDARFARALLEHRSTGRGRLAIASELKAKGVAREITDAALAELDPEVQVDAATRLAGRWLERAEPGSLQSLLEVAGPRLLRRGFAPGVVREACRRAMATDTR